MVLESIFKLASIKRHPHNIVFQSIVIASIGIWLGYWLFPGSASVAALGITAIGLLPIIQKLLVREEEEEHAVKNSVGFLERNIGMIVVFAWFFLGLMATYAVWYAVLPEQGNNAIPSRKVVFAEQTSTLQQVRSLSTAGLIEASPGDCFGNGKNVLGCTGFIFSRNFVVFILAILLSLLFGAGAIFLLAWNGSVLGVLIGQDALIAGKGGSIAVILDSIIHNTFGRAGFGIPEIVAYFIGVIAGGMISVSIAHGDIGKPWFGKIVKDVLVLIVVAVALLLAAALIEAVVIIG